MMDQSTPDHVGGVEGARVMTPFPTPQPGQGATNPPNPPGDANPSGNDGSGDLRAPHALDRARALAEDDTTVDRVVAALRVVERERLHPLGYILTDSELDAMARAAVRALREGDAS